MLWPRTPQASPNIAYGKTYSSCQQKTSGAPNVTYLTFDLHSDPAVQPAASMAVFDQWLHKCNKLRCCVFPTSHDRNMVIAEEKGNNGTTSKQNYFL